MGSTGPAAAGRTRHSTRAWWAVLVGLFAVGAALLWGNARSTWEFMSKDQGSRYQSAALWMQDHVPPGEKIFHLSWGDFPELFFFDPQLRYLVGLDPTFMYATDPEQWRLFDAVGSGEADDLFGTIQGTFGCRYVFATADAEAFLKKARRDPRFTIGYENPLTSVFALNEDRGFVGDWNLTGWWANPARRLFGVPLGPEPRVAGEPGRGKPAKEASASDRDRSSAESRSPGARGADTVSPSRAGPAGSPPEPEGRGAAGLVVHQPSGFIDLDKLLEIPAPVKDVCAVAATRLESNRSGRATLAVTTDDEIRVWLDGLSVLDNSPYLAPPAGQPGGPPLALDAPSFPGSHVPEQRIDVTLGAGGHSLVVKICRVGEDFGFYLRAAREDGTPLASSVPAR